jgi:hypothetical protein
MGSQGTGEPGIYGISIARSADDGHTFSDPVTILPNNFNNQNGNIVVLSDGTVVGAFFEIGRPGPDGSEFIEHPRLWVSASNDGALTFANPHIVSESFNRGWPVMGVHRPEGAPDTLFMGWKQQTQDGDEHEVVVVRSADEGRTWSDPVRVPGAAGRKGNVMLAVAEDGTVGVSWPDWSYGDGPGCYRMVFSASTDGGRSFLDPTPISPLSCSGVEGNAVPFAGGSTSAGERYPDGGDYHGLAVGSDDLFHVFWSDSRTGVHQSWTRVIGVERRDNEPHHPLIELARNQTR